MVLLERVLIMKLEKLSSILITHMVERENRLQKLSSDLQTCAIEVHEHKKIYKEKDEQINFREGKKGC